MKNIAIFASGSGTNAEAIIKYMRSLGDDRVKLVVSSRDDIGVIARADRLGVAHLTIKVQQMRGDADFVLDVLNRYEIGLIVLAGYLVHVPDYLVAAFPRRIINIHPSLLPAHGGKGMYGHFVHEDVLRCGDKKSGITIHYVNEQYDSGDIILQAECPVLENDTPDTLAERIHPLEYANFPLVVKAEADKLI